MSRSRRSHSSRRDLKTVAGLLALSFVLLATAGAQQRLSRALLHAAETDTPTVRLEGQSLDISPPQEKSTAIAMLLSAALPGAGQVYAERYITIPIIWGFGYYFGSQVVQLNDKYRDYRARYEASVAADTIAGIGDAQLRSIRDFYRDQRDEFAVYLGLTYILNIVDAYVGAALYGFDVSPDLSGTVRLRYSVPVTMPPQKPRKDHKAR